MLVCFSLSMPNIGSWNGEWTGQGKLYARVRRISNKNNLRDESSFRYNFGDGWSACVSVKFVDSKEAAKIRRKTFGFCGYEWMIDSIIKHGEIILPGDC